MVAANSLALEAQLEERPLARKQEELLDIIEESGRADQTVEGDEKDSKDTEKEKPERKPAEKVARKALLKNDDVELQRVSKVRRVCSPLRFQTLTYWRRYWKRCIRGSLVHIIPALRKINQRNGGRVRRKRRNRTKSR